MVKAIDNNARKAFKSFMEEISKELKIFPKRKNTFIEKANKMEYSEEEYPHLGRS